MSTKLLDALSGVTEALADLLQDDTNAEQWPLVDNARAVLAMPSEADSLREDLSDARSGWESAVEAVREVETERDQLRAKLREALIDNQHLAGERNRAHVAARLEVGDEMRKLRARVAELEADNSMLRALVNAGSEARQGVPDYVLDALDNLIHDNYERSYSGSKNREADAEIVRCTLLAAAPTPLVVQPAENLIDAYQGAREDLSIWKRRALEAEEQVRQQERIIAHLTDDINSANGPTFMGEPALPALEPSTVPVKSLGDSVIVADMPRGDVPEPAAAVIAEMREKANPIGAWSNPSLIMVESVIINAWADRLERAQWPQTAEPVEYDEDLHDAWQDRLVELVKQYRDAEAGHEVRDAFRAITAHINVLPMSMAMLPAEARAGLTIQANEIDRLRAHIADLDDQLGDMRRDLNDARSAQQPAQDVARDAELITLIADIKAWHCEDWLKGVNLPPLEIRQRIESALAASKGTEQ